MALILLNRLKSSRNWFELRPRFGPKGDCIYLYKRCQIMPPLRAISPVSRIPTVAWWRLFKYNASDDHPIANTTPVMNSRNF
jgi:hypothetical protein